MLVLTSTVRLGDLVMRKSWIKCGMMVSAITMLGIVAMVTSAEAQQQDVLRIEGAPDVSTVSASSASTRPISRRASRELRESPSAFGREGDACD